MYTLAATSPQSTPFSFLTVVCGLPCCILILLSFFRSVTSLQSAPFPSLNGGSWVALLNHDSPLPFPFTQQRKYVKGYFVVFVILGMKKKTEQHTEVFFQFKYFSWHSHSFAIFFFCNTNVSQLCF